LKESKSYPSIRTLLPESLIGEPAGENAGSNEAAGDESNTYSKVHLFAVFTDCILSLADEQTGLILCIEDLEWADAETLELFLHVCRYAKDKKLILLGSYCCPDNENLRGFLHNLQVMDAYAGVVKVQGVTMEETRSIVRYWIGDDKADQLMSERLHQLTGGNPFFISEILRGIAESEISMDIFRIIDTFQFPLTIHNAVNYRLSRLGQTERKVLEVAAVIGCSFNFEQLIEPSGLTAMQVLDALDEIVNRHFLFVRSSKYAFAHDLLRKSILEGMGPIRRKYLEKVIKGEI
jgi:predicted ATPase